MLCYWSSSCKYKCLCCNECPKKDCPDRCLNNKNKCNYFIDVKVNIKNPDSFEDVLKSSKNGYVEEKPPQKKRGRPKKKD